VVTPPGNPPVEPPCDPKTDPDCEPPPPPPPPPVDVPEPATWLLLIGAFGVLLTLARKARV
jgi:hypothetical protein